jgi:hypothetical protein
MCASNDKGSKAAQRAEQRRYPLHRVSHALEAHGLGPLGPSGVAGALLVDSNSTRVSTASQDACNEGKAMAAQVGRHKVTSPKHHPAGTHLKLHLKRTYASAPEKVFSKSFCSRWPVRLLSTVARLAVARAKGLHSAVRKGTLSSAP